MNELIVGRVTFGPSQSWQMAVDIARTLFSKPAPKPDEGVTDELVSTEEAK